MTRREQRARFVERLRGQGSPARIDTRASVYVHVHDLVLHGFPAADARRVADGVGVELVRLFSTGGVPRAMSAAHQAQTVQAGTIRVLPGVAGAPVGRQIARAVYGVRRP
jgi:hypothetical protein